MSWVVYLCRFIYLFIGSELIADDIFAHYLRTYIYNTILMKNFTVNEVKKNSINGKMAAHD